MSVSFEQSLKRYNATGTFSQAFLLCLKNLKDPVVGELAINSAKALIRQQKYDVFEQKDKRYLLQVHLDLDVDWLLDLAIELGYKEVERIKISTGWFSSIDGIRLGGWLAKHSYGIEKKKDGWSVIIFKKSVFYDDYKMITAICDKIVQMYLK